MRRTMLLAAAAALVLMSALARGVGRVIDADPFGHGAVVIGSAYRPWVEDPVHLPNRAGYTAGMTQRVGPKGQVVIPKTIRDELGIRPGDEVMVTLEGRAVRIVAAAALVRLRGILEGHTLVEILEREHREELEQEGHEWRT